MSYLCIALNCFVEQSTVRSIGTWCSYGQIDLLLPIDLNTYNKNVELFWITCTYHYTFLFPLQLLSESIDCKNPQNLGGIAVQVLTIEFRIGKVCKIIAYGPLWQFFWVLFTEFDGQIGLENDFGCGRRVAQQSKMKLVRHYQSNVTSNHSQKLHMLDM